MEREPTFSKYPALPLENIKQKLLPLFKSNRNNCIDDIPPERVREDDPNYHRYKCRTNWFNSSLNGIAVAMGQITDPLCYELEAELEYFRTQVDWQAMRTREEIDRVNAMLDKVIAYFEQL